MSPLIDWQSRECPQYCSSSTKDDWHTGGPPARADWHTGGPPARDDWPAGVVDQSKLQESTENKSLEMQTLISSREGSQFLVFEVGMMIRNMFL